MRPILAIDPATKCGWAGRWPNGEIHSGVEKLKGMDEERLYRYAAFLECFTFRDPIVIYETPHFMPGRSSSGRVGMHLEATLWMVLQHKKHTLLKVAAPALKHHATGKGNCNKELVIKAMRKRWKRKDLTDDNEADALALLSYAIDWQEGEKIVRVRSINR